MLLSKSFAYFGADHAKHRITDEELLSLLPKYQEYSTIKQLDTGLEKLKL